MKLFKKVAILSASLAMVVASGLVIGKAGMKSASAAGEVTMTAGNNAQKCNIKVGTEEFAAVKAGTGKTGGTALLTVPANSINLSMYVAAWNKTNPTLTISYGTKEVEVAIKPDAGIKGNPPYTLSGDENNYLVTTSLTDINLTTEITLSCEQRFVVWNPTVEVGASTNPTVDFENRISNMFVGDTGTLTAITTNATNPVVTWSSQNEDIITIDSVSGEYSVVKVGEATLVVSLTCDELTDPITATMKVNVNYGLVTIEEANNIANPLASTETAKFTLTVRGYITKLDADGKNRMLQISDKKIGEEGANSINIYGVYSDNAMRNYIILNGEVTFTGNPAKFKDAIQIANPSLVEYTDEAIKFATAANLALDSECAALDVKEETWNTIQGSFNGLDEYAQAKLKAATSKYEYNEEIQDFVARYDLIVAKYNYANFMSRVVSSARVLNATQNSSNNLMITIIMISFAVTLSAGYFFIRKKKAK